MRACVEVLDGDACVSARRESTDEGGQAGRDRQTDGQTDRMDSGNEDEDDRPSPRPQSERVQKRRKREEENEEMQSAGVMAR